MSFNITFHTFSLLPHFYLFPGIYHHLTHNDIFYLPFFFFFFLLSVSLKKIVKFQKVRTVEPLKSWPLRKRFHPHLAHHKYLLKELVKNKMDARVILQDKLCYSNHLLRVFLSQEKNDWLAYPVNVYILLFANKYRRC